MSADGATERSIRPAFVLSLPRSGSTLLQRLIGAHSQVATAAEPWLLLAPLYALRRDGVFAEYGHGTAYKALQDLCDGLPNGQDDDLAAVAAMAHHVYGRLAPADATVFLDKTPRYSLVAGELLRAFPTTPMIVLHRNPLAVLASVSETFDRGRWQPYLHKVDLYLALERLLAAQADAPERLLAVRYEDLVVEPEATLRGVLSHLGLDWEPSVLERFTRVSVAGRVGDPTGTVAYDSVSTASVEKWRTQLSSPVRKAWCRRYVRWIGADRLRLMGYELDDLLADLSGEAPDWGGAPTDVLHTVRGVVHNLADPEVVRAKTAVLPRWREVLGHT
ncbi:MAG TPA: sulfotransferase [Euzebya sp.]|nr:sulfotransferase [Euzebya sp.]